MAGARDPQPAAMTQQLMDEAKVDSGNLADMLFGEDPFTDSTNRPRPEYLAFLRFANEHGAFKKDGTYVPADQWAMEQRVRTGDDRFWQDLHEAYGLDPAQGLAQVRLAMEPPPGDFRLDLPPVPTEEG
jgi:hypothetical protein